LDDVLWVCGRDGSICRHGLGHALEPIPFEAFNQEPKRYVKSLSTCEQHTLVVTYRKDDRKADTEIWVWGKNNYGQLVLPETIAPRIDSPWLLRLDDATDGKRLEAQQVATASGHSLVLMGVRPKAPKKDAAERSRVQQRLGDGVINQGKAEAHKQKGEDLMKEHNWTQAKKGI